MALSVGLLVAFAGLVVTGLVAWVSPRQQPTRIEVNTWVQLTPTPLFDQGTTVFASPTSDGMPPTASSLACRIESGSGEAAEVVQQELASVGSRVRDDVSLLPALHLGRIKDGSRLMCQGAFLAQGEAWVLPTQPARSPGGMALIVAGVDCLGLAVLTNPRVRGYAPR